MADKWSDKTEKFSLFFTDELLIIDSQDPNPATQNKRIKASSAFFNGPATFSHLTVGATSQQQTFIFNGAITLNILIVGSNAGSTKGYAANYRIACTIQNVSSVNVFNASDFGPAGVSIVTAPNLITVTMTGEAGETITWVGHFEIATI